MQFLSGDEAVATAAFDAGVKLGSGYPGTPSTEILERFETLGGQAQWSPNEKVALEVGIGVAYAGARAIVTMKHVGLNVAADPLFTVAYTGVSGALVIVSADDPGLASSQNEQDNRRYAVAARCPCWSRRIRRRRTTSRCVRLRSRSNGGSRYYCESPRGSVTPKRWCGAMKNLPQPRAAEFVRDVRSRVMIPAFARPAHHNLREKLRQLAAWNENDGPNQVIEGSASLGIITSGISYQHVREAATDASVLKLGLTYPLPLQLMRKFASGVERCLVVEEGDPYLVEAALTAGIPVQGKPDMFRFGELNVDRVRRIVAGDTSPEPKPVAGKPPALCPGCGHRSVFASLKNLDCIVAGDIGCYSLGVLPPFDAMDSVVCMGASIGVGLGMRHALPPEQAKRVVSVIGDSTFVHSGITGLVEMIYNPPPTGHVLLILDNGTTAMTGMQEHAGTGRTLDHAKTGKVVFEDLARLLGVPNVVVIDPTVDTPKFEKLVRECLDKPELSVIVARRNCLLAARHIREYERCNEQQGN